MAKTTIAANLLMPGMILGNGMPVLWVNVSASGRAVHYGFATALGERASICAGIDSIVIRA